MDRLINMVMRQVVSRVVGKGIDFGAEQMARRTGGGGEQAELSGEQRAQVRNTKRNARQAMRLARRIGRF
ncbi:hypothetical protein N8I71_11025 [Roseibacterium sp. SDUM158016]|nr:hypothetical protein [Roseibacterium sp. SDUM158016]